VELAQGPLVVIALGAAGILLARIARWPIVVALLVIAGFFVEVLADLLARRQRHGDEPRLGALARTAGQRRGRDHPILPTRNPEPTRRDRHLWLRPAS
jgi:hypothetical protein